MKLFAYMEYKQGERVVVRFSGVGDEEIRICSLKMHHYVIVFHWPMGAGLVQ